MALLSKAIEIQIYLNYHNVETLAIAKQLCELVPYFKPHFLPNSHYFEGELVRWAFKNEDDWKDKTHIGSLAARFTTKSPFYDFTRIIKENSTMDVIYLIGEKGII
jgi:hypothetical protein